MLKLSQTLRELQENPIGSVIFSEKFEEIYFKFLKPINDRINKLCHSNNTVDTRNLRSEILQQTQIQFMDSVQKFDLSKYANEEALHIGLKNYLCRIAENKFFDQIRYNEKQLPYDDKYSASVEDHQSQLAFLEQDELRDELRLANKHKIRNKILLAMKQELSERNMNLLLDIAKRFGGNPITPEYKHIKSLEFGIKLESLERIILRCKQRVREYVEKH